MPLQKLANEQGYLKAGFLGFAKSGKTYTATKLAIGTIKLFKLEGPVALFDTESGSNYIADMVKSETGKDLLGVRARSFDSLMQFARDCIAEKVSVAIIDSITHPWNEIMESYLAQLNDKRKAKGWAPLAKLEFQNWSAIKAMWEEWPTFFLNSPLHIIVCGRAGFTWEMEKNDETGRRELVQTGVKMKVESNFGFEPSMLVEMEREQVADGDGGFKIVHRATVLGDRFAVMDGATQINPDFSFFQPHVEKLRPGLHAPVNTTSKTDTGADLEGGGDWERERRERTILAEEIQGAIVTKYPGQSADDKKAKADLMQLIFGTRSWTRVENMQSTQLREGLDRLRKHLGIDQQPELSTNGTDDGDLAPQTEAESLQLALSCPVIALLSRDDYHTLHSLPKSDIRGASEAQSQILLKKVRDGTGTQGLSLVEPSSESACFIRHNGSDLRVAGEHRLIGQRLLGFQGLVAVLLVRFTGDAKWSGVETGRSDHGLQVAKGDDHVRATQQQELRHPSDSRGSGSPLSTTTSVAELPPLPRIRAFIKESPKPITEQEVIATLSALNMVTPGMVNLDQVALLEPAVLQSVADNWGKYRDAAFKFKEQMGGVSK